MTNEEQIKRHFKAARHLHEEEDDLDGAIVEYTKAIELDPDNATAYNNRGHVFYAKGDYEKALSDSNTAIRINDKDAIFYNNRGIVFHALEKYEEAADDFSKAIEIDPNNMRYVHSRAVSKALQLAKIEQAKLERKMSDEYDAKIKMTLERFEEKLERFEKQLEVDTKEFGEKEDEWFRRSEVHKKHFYISLLIFFGLVVSYGVVLGCLAWPEVVSSADPFLFLPWLGLAAIIFTPLIWATRTLEANHHKALTLSHAFQRARILELRIAAYSVHNAALREDLLQQYVHHWMTSSPVEVLISMRSNKKGGFPMSSIFSKIKPGGEGG